MGGLGSAIVTEFAKVMEGRPWALHDWSTAIGVDVSSSFSVEKAAAKVHGPVDILINCAGVNRLDWIPNLQEEDWDQVMDTNAKGIFLCTQALLPKLRGGTILNIISNAARVPMTASLAYNASKAAAEMMTKQMARELFKTHQITVFGISPNKLKGTPMSIEVDRRVGEVRGWPPEYVREYQLASIPIGEETDPATLAEFIAFLLSTKERHRYLHGCIIPYGGP